MFAIQTKGLTRRYGKARGVTGLNLSVREGEFFGFIGPNGAGKSTTIRLLLGLIAPTAGKARVLGHGVRGDRRALLAEVGYLPSEVSLYARMRVRDALRFSAGLRGMDCAREAARLCDRLELDPSRRVDELSFGNRKKVGIVCAMQHQPRLLILDEPTSGLDPLMQRAFFSLLHEQNEAGATVFLSSHILSEIQRNCTRAAIIREGRLIACGSVESLSGGSTRRVTVRPAVALGGLGGVRDVQQLEDGVSFLYGGEMSALIDALRGRAIDDLTIAELSLEEVFMHYYTGDEVEGGEEA